MSGTARSLLWQRWLSTTTSVAAASCGLGPMPYGSESKVATRNKQTISLTYNAVGGDLAICYMYVA